MDLASALSRARDAINRAKALSESFHSPDPSNQGGGASRSLLPTEDSGLENSNASPASLCVTAQSSTSSQTSHASAHNEHQAQACNSTNGTLAHVSQNLPDIQPLIDAATRLATLQQQQAHSLQQLLALRVEQLRLRQQQLTALLGLLRSEITNILSTGLEMHAAHQAASLLAMTLSDIDTACALVHHSEGLSAITAAVRVVSQVDKRAEDIGEATRHLLDVLRDFPSSRRTGTSSQPVGASPHDIASLSRHTCEDGSPLLDQHCPICLDVYSAGSEVKCMDCVHYFHAGCLDRWLAIQAVCPLCKLPM